MNKVVVPDLTSVAYQLYVDGTLVGYVSVTDYHKLIALNAPKFITVALHSSVAVFTTTATVNTERISWLQPTKLTK